MIQIIDTCFIKDVEVDGYRIADFNFVLRQLGLQIHSDSKICKHIITESSLVSYVDRGLRTRLYFQCEHCDYPFHISNVPDDGCKMGLNGMAVCG